jgi:hypothetical protein
MRCASATIGDDPFRNSKPGGFGQGCFWRGTNTDQYKVYSQAFITQMKRGFLSKQRRSNNTSKKEDSTEIADA